MRKLFEGIKVLDFSANLAGPVTGTQLADYGAEVIHVEPPVLGDMNRDMPPRVDKIGLSSYIYNRGKASVVLDPRDPRGLKALKLLAQEADVIIEASRPGVVKKMGWGYDEVVKTNPKVIYCSISCYGQTGPLATAPGYDSIAQAFSGFMDRCGMPGGTPYINGTIIGDFIGAAVAFGQIVAALYHRKNTGEGQYIDMSLARNMVWLSARFDYRYGFKEPTRTGIYDPNFSPSGLFKGKGIDDYVALTADTQEKWQAVCQVIGKPELADDPRFATNDLRMKNNAELAAIIEEWVRAFDSMEEAAKQLRAVGVSSCRLYSMKDINEDPHFNLNGWIYHQPVPDGVETIEGRRAPTLPYFLSDVAPAYTSFEPLGLSNHPVLERIGFTPEEIDAMEAEWTEKYTRK